MLYKAIGQTDKALLDCDSIVYIAGEEKNIQYEVMRARLKCDSLHYYKEVIHDLNQLLSTANNRTIMKDLYNWGSVFYYLAKAQFGAHDVENAVYNWLIAFDINCEESRNAKLMIPYIDSLIKKYPQYPELFLSKTLAYFNSRQYYEDKSNNALLYLQEAENRGINDYRINKYRARVFIQMQYDNEKVENEQKKALSKNERYRKLYESQKKALNWKLIQENKALKELLWDIKNDYFHLKHPGL